MDDRDIRVERAQNLWNSFERKNPILARGAHLTASPVVDFARIGGLAAPKEELETYACAATRPDVYDHWGTFPPTAVLLIGQRGCGKTLLAEALAHRTDTAFLRIDVPRIVLDVVHSGGQVGDFLSGWSETLEEMPPLTGFFDEFEFSQAEEIGGRRGDLPIGPIMDFLLELVDRTIAAGETLVVGSTSHPDSLRPAFLVPKRFERVVEVTPIFPDDVIAALQLHAADAEKRAGRPLFQEIEWAEVTQQEKQVSIGDWVRLVHGALRRKARCEAAGEQAGAVTTKDLQLEVDRFRKTRNRLPAVGRGNYV